MANTDVSKELAKKFKNFINSQDYDPLEVAMLCRQVLDENRVQNSGSPYVIGVRLFED